MPCHGRPSLIALFCLVALADNARAQHSFSASGIPALPGQESSPVLQAWREDAMLHDVQLVGTKSGWAVGDHGAIWHTRDGGLTWESIDSPVQVPLRHVCFLTDRVGWIAGGETTPHTRLSTGVVLATQDGGATWELLGTDVLPRLHFVKFFDMEVGIAAGDASAKHPSGLFITDDGGQTWRDVAGQQPSGWRNGDFLSPEDGVVVGERGRAFFVSGGRLLEPQFAELRLQSLAGVRMQAQAPSWVVGDGATVRTLTPGSVVWQDPPGRLPDALRHIADFTAVAARGSHVWLAGRPGSVIWHSDDAGQTWTPQPTQQPQAIIDLEFSSESHGVAVGAFGTILHTSDGGKTWQAVRGDGRRAALLAIHARPEQVSFALLAQQAGELGYRAVAFLPFRRDTAQSGMDDGLGVTLHEAVTAAGGSAAERGWKLPIDLPDLDHDSDKLVAEWNRQTDGRLNDAFIGDLVCRIRSWRPSVVVLDEPGPDDAAVKLLNEAVLKALSQAADPAAYAEQQRYAGLGAWQVGKVYMKLAPGSTGQVAVDPHEPLPRLGALTASLVTRSRGRLPERSRTELHREAYRVVESVAEHTGHVTAGGFFSGMSLSAGSEARRALLPYDDTRSATAQRHATKQRHFNATVFDWLNSPTQAAAMVGQLESFLREIPDDQGAQQLDVLAEEYRRQSRWDLVEMTLTELVERYPRHPLAEDGMRWLFQFWASAEISWQRSRETNAKRSTYQSTEGGRNVADRVQQALELANVDPRQRDVKLAAASFDALEGSSQGLGLSLPQENMHRMGTSAIWQQQALSSIRRIRENSPRLAESPQVQFPLASLLRRRDVYASSDRIYQEYLTTGADQTWKQTAAAELWLTQPTDVAPKLPVACRRTDVRPVLDGTLSDPCWLDAAEIPLRRSADETVNEAIHAFVMLAYDEEYLYLAASIPREPGQRDDPPRYEGRTHDADLTGYDRLAVQLDVDRDYATWYDLQIDQRGWTRDRCWQDLSWNPKWYVAADGDERHWRIEAAIPFVELVPQPPANKDVWAVGLTRIIPAVGVQGWTHPATEIPRPAAFGLIRFE